MTDLDIVRRVRNFVQPNANIITKNDNRELRYKDIHVLTVHGHLAVGWMMTIYPLMSKRRQQKIKDLLSRWKANSLRHEKITGKRAETRRIYKNLARKHGISWPEVRRRLQKGEITSVN